MLETHTKIYDKLIDIKAQNHEHQQKIEKIQKDILIKMSNTSNKVSLIYFLFGVICGLLLNVFFNDILEFVEPVSELVKMFLNLKKIGED